MSKNNIPVSVVISTREIDDEYLKHVEKMFSHPKTEILVYENDGVNSLTEIYNIGLKEAKNDIIVFMHDDLILETPNITPKVVKLFEKHPEYGIIGVAGTDKLLSGRWWDSRDNMFGVVGHIHEGKRHVNKYSKGSYNDVLKNVVIVDGLFFAVDRTKLKHNFDNEFNGFHFYDLSFCIPNHLDGVKIGLVTDITVTHLSIGVTNQKWEDNKKLLEKKYAGKFPMVV